MTIIIVMVLRKLYFYGIHLNYGRSAVYRLDKYRHRDYGALISSRVYSRLFHQMANINLYAHIPML